MYTQKYGYITKIWISEHTGTGSPDSKNYINYENK